MDSLTWAMVLGVLFGAIFLAKAVQSPDRSHQTAYGLISLLSSGTAVCIGFIDGLILAVNEPGPDLIKYFGLGVVGAGLITMIFVWKVFDVNSYPTRN